MALGFFRKRQKLIFIIMVVLMVSFLIGFQGFNTLFHEKPGEFLLGEAPDFKVRAREVQAARADIDQLGGMLQSFGPRSAVRAYSALLGANENPSAQAMAYVLLQREADEKGFGVSDAEVEQFVQQMKAIERKDAMGYDQYVLSLRQNRGVPEKDIRAVLARWLRVQKAYETSATVIPPSREELLHRYRQRFEMMDLELVQVTAEKFMDQTAEPSEQQVKDQFETYKNRAPNVFTKVDELPFGYLEPARADVAYILVLKEAVERGSVPTDTEIQDWIIAHQAKLTKLAPTSQSTAAPSVVPMTYPEKREAALAALTPPLVQAKMLETADRARQAVLEALDAKMSYADAVQKVVADMTFPADEMVGRKIPVIAIQAQPLDEAIRTVAAMASPRLGAIVFPWGDHGDVKIDPTVKVSLTGKNLTVGEALAKITAQIPDLKLTWGACRGFDGVLFATSGVRVFPVTAGRTGLLPQDKLAADAPLSRSYFPGPGGPEDYRPFGSVDLSALKVGAVQEDMPVATATGTMGGTLLWRLVDYKPAHSPEALTDELKKIVADDLRRAKAFELAKQAAEAVISPAAMQALAKKLDLKPFSTGLFSQAWPTFVMQGKVFRSPAAGVDVVNKAFADLAPKNLAGDYPQTSANVLAVPLASELMVVLARRTDFRPAMEEPFDATRSQLVGYIMGDRQRQIALDWFAEANVMKRTSFTKTTAEEE